MTRSLIRLSGSDATDFLQGLVTNDLNKLSQGPVYAALLTPQGKYLADFFVIADGDDLLIDVATDLSQGLMQRLSMYKLRADVRLSEEHLHLHRGLGEPPADGWTDPRHPEMGWRAWRREPQTEDPVDWDARRVANLVPETGVELTPDSFILEMNFDAMNGVDFRKGCYVGQEVTARMRHKTRLRKGLARVHVSGEAEPGAEITADGRSAGKLLTRSGDEAIAYLRFDKAEGEMECGSARVTRTS